MPTIFSHAAVGFIAAKCTTDATAPNTRVVLASMALSALPDSDGLLFGTIPYDHPFGHRGFTHSLFFASLVGSLAALIFSKSGWGSPHSFWRLAIVFGLVTASHGFFDAMTNGGLGVAFFAPFTNTRYFLPWRPIPVAPMSLAGLMTSRGLQVIRTEAALFWLFSLGVAIWDRKTSWRMAFATACVMLGIICWVIAVANPG